MARLTGNNIEQFRSGGSGDKIDYFSLKDDKDTAQIRLLYDSAEDIDGYVIHRVKVGDYELPVNCLVEQGGSIDDCPFCKAGYQKQARVYIPVFDESDGKIKFWDRPNSFYGKLTGLLSRYPNIVSRVFEVERHGQKGKKSDYDFYPVGDADKTTIDDLLDECGYDDLPSPLGTKILDKSADDMETYLQTGSFDAEEDIPSRRTRQSEPSRKSRRDETADAPFEIDDNRPQRRGRSNRSRGDAY